MHCIYQIKSALIFTVKVTFYYKEGVVKVCTTYDYKGGNRNCAQIIVNNGLYGDFRSLYIVRTGVPIPLDFVYASRLH